MKAPASFALNVVRSITGETVKEPCFIGWIKYYLPFLSERKKKANFFNNFLFSFIITSIRCKHQRGFEIARVINNLNSRCEILISNITTKEILILEDERSYVILHRGGTGGRGWIGY